MTAAESSNTVEVTVTGMTCEHCVASVREEIGEIPGVEAVDVDLTSGRVTIGASAPIEHSAIATAVDEAGYALAE
ncbi:heavy metal-associated domain-containing protein [Rhodococcus sp. HNM0569]|uniref:heavy-metal-associated domain-containing protein n=1 Tax=Rhodococcus sp. HNM0569 TaxID=2716340 RepID=UPI00146BA677|nr:heavy metal-associated domain-containing protein [Rhodococcus sp. HNM0569]NLU84555.1 heavy-metal-associated domain-containing protein [Rhodococcus sp. HNM0569]